MEWRWRKKGGWRGKKNLEKGDMTMVIGSVWRVV